ncbi:hypothetical protein [Actinokineospora sp. NBRC 105648]|uniref:hypothetical protein n=1 Tax=Actinokineospora sp. NBRC 105648 TaxID=3032206 RepID=UPI0024A2F602|nr:hypothetical protein [Actinokineospora sp. NBRC 105648]GLZ39401.1 hypothetical protein Acsp05_30250 [Actinokineospora sp. NBRC 105648]
MGKDVAVIGLIALAGILIGGVYTTWKTAKVMAGILLVLALLAAGGAIAWYVSG